MGNKASRKAKATLEVQAARLSPPLHLSASSAGSNGILRQDAMYLSGDSIMSASGPGDESALAIAESIHFDFNQHGILSHSTRKDAWQLTSEHILVVTMYDAAELLRGLINDVAETLSCPKHIALLLLAANSVRFDKETLLTEFFEDGERRLKFLAAAGAVGEPTAAAADGMWQEAARAADDCEFDEAFARFLSEAPAEEDEADENKRSLAAALAAAENADDDASEALCEVCFCETPKHEMWTATRCGHAFCRDCWAAHLDSAAKSALEAVHTKCMAAGCGVQLDALAWRRWSSREAVFRQWLQYVARAFVDTSESARWCTNPRGCTHVLYAASTPVSADVHCVCGWKLCFACGSEAHAPATCDEWRAWQEQVQKDAGSVSWISKNTKLCPKCKAPIEKNGGCLHMTCRGCGHHFCWQCKKNWNNHNDYYNCNKFDPNSPEAREDREAAAKLGGEAFVFYYERYEFHRDAFERTLAQRRSGSESERLRALLRASGYESLRFIDDAIDVLLASRRIIMCGFAHGYRLAKERQASQHALANNISVDLFDQLQEELVKLTDKLFTRLISLPADYKASMERGDTPPSSSSTLLAAPRLIDAFKTDLRALRTCFTRYLECIDEHQI